MVIIKLNSENRFDFKSSLSKFFKDMVRYIQEQPLYNIYWLLMFLKRNSEVDLGNNEMGLQFNQNYINARCHYCLVLVEVNRAMVENAVGNEAMISSIDDLLKRSTVSVGMDEESVRRVNEMEIETVEDILMRMYGEVPNFAPLDKLRDDYNKLREELEQEKQRAEQEKQRAEQEKQRADELEKQLQILKQNKQ